MSNHSTATTAPHPQCAGYQLALPPGSHPFTSYPLMMHEFHDLPWSVFFHTDGITLFSTCCTAPGYHHSTSTRETSAPCTDCQQLHTNDYVVGIRSRLFDGVDDSTPLEYLTMGQMRALLEKKTKEHNTLRRQVQRKTKKREEHICGDCHLAILEEQKLILCSAAGCTRVFHLACRGMTEHPMRAWFCEQACEDSEVERLAHANTGEKRRVMS